MSKSLIIIKQALEMGGIILYPTDTIWGLGADATNISAVQKIYHLKNRPENKPLICLFSDLKMLKSYAEIPLNIDGYLVSEQPTTLLLPYKKGLAAPLIGPDNLIAARIPNHNYCQSIIQSIQKPIVSTSANISGKPFPSTYNEIDIAVKNGVDAIGDPSHEVKDALPSRILKIEATGVTEIRS